MAGWPLRAALEESLGRAALWACYNSGVQTRQYGRFLVEGFRTHTFYSEIEYQSIQPMRLSAACAMYIGLGKRLLTPLAAHVRMRIHAVLPHTMCTCPKSSFLCGRGTPLTLSELFPDTKGNHTTYLANGEPRAKTIRRLGHRQRRQSDKRKKKDSITISSHRPPNSVPFVIRKHPGPYSKVTIRAIAMRQLCLMRSPVD